MISKGVVTLLVIQCICLFSISSRAQDDEKSGESQGEEQADSTVSRGLSLNAYPYAYYTPETQFAVGAGGIMIFYTSDHIETLPSKITLGGYYTTNKQYKITLNPVLYFNRNQIYVSLPVSFGHFVDKFWGIGNNTPETGNEQYTLNTFSAELTFQVPPLWFTAQRAGIILDYEYTEIDDKQNNGLLLNDLVPGSNGGTLYGIGGDLIWDTRDNLFFPNSGGYQYFKMVVYPNLGDFVFYTLELDVRHFSAFSPDHVLAANFFFSAAAGETPFYRLPALGGDSRMRGYFEGRYRDNVYSTLQLEYRQYFWWRFGFVVFAGIGDVASDLTKFKMNELKPSGGVGLRFLFNKEEKVNLRVDLGFGEAGDRGIYFGIEESF
ncbi:MAG: BamA/TamA family outer membrane protein [Bacteroidota bacterium]